MSHWRHLSKWPQSCYHPLYVTITGHCQKTRNDFSKLIYFTLPVKQLTGTRCAGMPRYEDENIPQRIKSSFKVVFFFPWKVKRKVLSTFGLLRDNWEYNTSALPRSRKPPASSVTEVISSFLAWLGTAEPHSSMQPELGLGPATRQCPTAAPAPAPAAESGSDPHPQTWGWFNS